MILSIKIKTINITKTTTEWSRERPKFGRGTNQSKFR